MSVDPCVYMLDRASDRRDVCSEGFRTGREGKDKEGRELVAVKRLVYLATAAVVFMLVLVPAALAQQDMAAGDDHPHSPEPHPQVASHEELQRIAGQPVPSQHPGQHPGEVPHSPTTHSAPTQGGLPSTGGPSLVILPAAALLLVGSSVLAYTAVRRRGSRRG